MYLWVKRILVTILWSQSSLFLSKANALFYLHNVLSSENLFRNQRFKKSEFFCEHDLNLPVIIMLIFLNILLTVICYWLIFKRGCLLIAYVRDLVTECVFPRDHPLGASGSLSAVHRCIWGWSCVFNKAFNWNSVSSFELSTAPPRGGCSFHHMGYRRGEDWQDIWGLGEERGYSKFVYMDDYDSCWPWAS